MIEDQVLFHLPKFGKNIFSLRGFPHPLKGHEETVREGPRFGTLKSVSTLDLSQIFLPKYSFFILRFISYFRECVVAPQGETNKFFARTRFNLAQLPTRKEILL